MFGLILAFLPQIMQAASIIGTIGGAVGGAKNVVDVIESLKNSTASATLFDALKAISPASASVVEEIAKVVPVIEGIAHGAHLDAIVKALFIDNQWTPEQLEALKAYQPENAGGGSLGFNQELGAH